MRPLVIAHRGASAYLPEGTLPAKALAVGMGSDYVEHDVVMTRDDRLLINHDLWLDNVSDVALRFPGRQREDGHFYVIDFDLDEILNQSLWETVVQVWPYALQTSILILFGILWLLITVWFTVKSILGLVALMQDKPPI